MVECSGSSPTQTPFATCAQTMSAQPLRSSRFHPQLVEFFTLATCAEILCLVQISEIWICPLPRQRALPNAFTWNSALTRSICLIIQTSGIRSEEHTSELQS